MHLEDDGGGLEIDVKLIGRRRFRFGGACWPPKDGIGEILSIGHIDHQIVRLLGGAEGTLDLGVVIGGDDQKRPWHLRQKPIERRDGDAGERVWTKDLPQSLAQRGARVWNAS